MNASVAESHYDDDYFAWQNTGALIGAELNAEKFRPYIPRDVGCIVDFGCGGGHLLTQLPGQRKIGIEINEAAQRIATRQGLEVYARLASVADGAADCVISNHALEHVEHPLEVLRDVRRVLRPGGLFVLVIPCDRANYPYNPNDRDFHLYSWSAGNVANLARAAGLEVLESSELVHRWPPYWDKLWPLLPARVFHAACRVYGHLNHNRTQVRMLARKPLSA